MWLQAGVTSSSGYLQCEPATSYYCLTGNKQTLASDSTAFTGTVAHAGYSVIDVTRVLSVGLDGYRAGAQYWILSAAAVPIPILEIMSPIA